MKMAHLYVTAHAQRRALERDLTVELMENIVEMPTSQKQLRRPGPHGGIVYEFTRRNTDGNIVVIAEVWKTDCWLITAYRK